MHTIVKQYKKNIKSKQLTFLFYDVTDSANDRSHESQTKQNPEVNHHSIDGNVAFVRVDPLINKIM